MGVYAWVSMPGYLCLGICSWVSVPWRRSCKEHEQLGDNGCTWKRHPQSRMLYGGDLLANGWNTTNMAASAVRAAL